MIIRSGHVRGYTLMDNGFLRDKRLSAAQKGLLAMMLSLPNDWVFRLKPLQDMTGLGRDALENNLKALEHAGYLKRHGMKRGPDGRFVRAEWTVYEVSLSPYPENPDTDTPLPVQPDTKNPQLLNTNRVITNSLSTDISIARARKTGDAAAWELAILNSN